VRGEETGEVAVARLLENREIAAVDHPPPQRASASDQTAELGIHLGGATGQVEDFDRRARGEQLEQPVGDRRGQHLGALRPGFDMAVVAGEVAQPPDVDLQRRRPGAGERA
jgi:hypothetical protein